MSFLSDFFEIDESTEETAVCCPFEHLTASGYSYQENNPSAHVNTEKGLFHCKVCDAGYSEVQFIQNLLTSKYAHARKLQALFNVGEPRTEWLDSELTEESIAKAEELGITEKVLAELDVRTSPISIDNLAFPVFMYERLLDIRTYNPGGKPKIKSRMGSMNGLVIPFDIWKDTNKNRWTVLCAGEKDMAVARTKGFNAITLTGGENATPACLAPFKDRKIAICYDNDDAGIQGAKHLAQTLLPLAKEVRVVTNFHKGMENKEDITDYFIKYNRSKQDLTQCIKTTPKVTPDETYDKKTYKQVDLLQASRKGNIGKVLQSNIQVIAVADTTFSCPKTILAEKFKVEGGLNNMQVGDCRTWELNENNCQDILHYIDNSFTEEMIAKNIRNVLHIMQKEPYVKITKPKTATVFKCAVTDLFETNNTANSQPMEYTAYSIDQKLESGRKYLITYKLVPHPYKGQQLMMIVLDAAQANDTVANFKVTPEVKRHLQEFQDIPGDVADKIETLTEKVKGLLSYNGNNQLIQTIDLAYHTVLNFNFGNFKNVRGYLDTIIVGESRMGKSSTAETLRTAYQLGTFTSLAGNSATIPGLVGGSNKTGTGFQTRAGIIPQNHKGLIIFEELGKSNASVITELTDIRSSNEVRITRVAGNITLPAMVRMIALTNPKSGSNTIKPIAAYPNGIAVITELVQSAEDIARYDMIAILGDRGNNQIDPLWQPEEPMSEAAYKTRVRWVWSREPEDVILSSELEHYIVSQANKLNKKYESHIKIFGTEAWKKITRLAIAVAGYTVSTDDSFEKLIVEQEHVDYAVQFLVNLYDNPVFKFKEYVDYQKQYSTLGPDNVAALQEIYKAYPLLILHLEQSSSSTKSILGSFTGLETAELNRATNSLAKGLFIQFSGNEIIPTERFRKGVNQINRDSYTKTVGE